MKVWLAFILCGILTGYGLAQKPPKKSPFTLTLGGGPTASLNTGVWVKVQWTNTSDRPLDSSANILDAQNVDPNFLFDLLDDTGRPVPKKVYKFPETSGHAEFGTLKPGESITHDVNLVRIFQLKKPGKYSLQVSRAIPEGLGHGTIKSNIVTLNVTQ